MTRAVRLIPFVALVTLAACGKKRDQRAEVIECSSISLDVKGTTQCLVQLYHWEVAAATRTATARHREIDSLRLKRRDVETSIETTILTLRSTLEHVRESSQRNSNNEKVLLVHRPRAVAEPAAVDTAPVAVSR